METRLLIVDDNERICTAFKKYTEKSTNYVVDYVTSSNDALAILSTKRYHLVILDIQIGTESGFDLINDIKQKYDLPVIFISCLTSNQTVIEGFELGADDYVKKPFEMKELLLRIERSLKRTNRINYTQYGDYVVDNDSNVAYYDQQKINLSTIQVKVLVALVEARGEVISREEIFRQIWDSDHAYSSRVIDVHVSAIRNELTHEKITSIRGVGYRLEN